MGGARSAWAELPAEVAQNVVKRLLSTPSVVPPAALNTQEQDPPPGPGYTSKRRRKEPTADFISVVDGFSAWERACERGQLEPLPFASRGGDGLCGRCWPDAAGAPDPTSSPDFAATAAASARLASTTFASAIDKVLPALTLGSRAENADPASAVKFEAVRSVKLLAPSRSGSGVPAAAGSGDRVELGFQASSLPYAGPKCTATAVAPPPAASTFDVDRFDVADSGYCCCCQGGAIGVGGRLAVAAALPRLTSLDSRGCALTDRQQLRQLAALKGLRRLALGHFCDESAVENSASTKDPVQYPYTPCDDVHVAVSAEGCRQQDGSSQAGSVAPPGTAPSVAAAAVAESLAALPHLTALDLSACNATSDAALAQLAAARPALACLRLANCWPLTWQGVRGLAPLAQSLTCLDLAGCRQSTYTGSPLLALAPLTRLASLSLRSCDQLAAADLAHLPLSLSTLDLSYCAQLSAEEGVIGDALGRLPVLAHVSLVGTQAGDADMAAMGSSPALRRNLRSLRLGLCCQLTDSALVSGIARLACLSTLSLAFCSGVTDAGICGLAPLGALRELDVAGCYKVSASQLPPLGKLERLDLSQTAVDDEALTCLVQRSRTGRLRKVRVAGCSRLSVAGLDALPGLTVEHD